MYNTAIILMALQVVEMYDVPCCTVIF